MTSDWPQRCISLRPPSATLGDLIEPAMAIDPDRVAIVFEGSETSYAQLDHAANRVANVLLEQGVEPGDRVAVQLENRPEFVELFVGIMRAGAVMVPANIMYRSGEMRHLLSDSGAKVLFVSNAVSDRLPEVVPELGDLKQVVELGEPVLEGSRRYDELLDRASLERPSVQPRPEDYAVIQYTSGTTGRPKGAVVSHANILTAIDTIATLPRYPIHERSVALLCLPLFHTFGLIFGAGLSFGFGLRMVLIQRFDPELVFELTEQHRVTLLWGVPPMYVAFVNTPGLERFDVSSLEHVMTGAAILPVPIVERFRELTSLELSDGYGMSESSAILTFNTVGPVIKQGSVGPSYPGVDLSIQDDQGQELPPGEVGEICARGEIVFQGYWNNPEATEEAMRGGWLHTGDLGWKDEDGYVYIVGRDKDLVIVSGYNVYPSEVEEVLLRHPGVLDCAVIGVPDDYQGESVCAVVVPRPEQEPTAQRLIDHCRESLAAFKCPRKVVFRDGIPKSASGKILKRLLKDQDTGGA